MYCPGCGSQLPDGFSICGYCGTPLNGQPQAPSNQKARVSGFDKKAKFLIPITFLMTLALLVVSVILPLSGSIVDIPAVSLLAGIAGDLGDDIDEELEDLEEFYDQMEIQFEENQDLLSKDAAKATKKIMKAFKQATRNPTLLTMNNLVSVMDEEGEELDGEYDILNLSSASGMLEDIREFMGILIAIVVGMFTLPGIFTIVGGLLKSTGMTIAALVFMVISQLLLCGILWASLSLVVYTIQAILCHKARRAKRQSRYAY